MTPKNKANELFEKYYQINKNHDFDFAKQCALIAVLEILRAAFFAKDEVYNFYIEVLQEIELL